MTADDLPVTREGTAYVIRLPYSVTVRAPTERDVRELAAVLWARASGERSE